MFLLNKKKLILNDFLLIGLFSDQNNPIKREIKKTYLEKSNFLFIPGFSGGVRINSHDRF